MAVRTYRLTVDGELSDRAIQAFEGMTLTREDGKTALTGKMRDQAELQGYLQRVSHFGLSLLSVTLADEPQSTEVSDSSNPGRQRAQTERPLKAPPARRLGPTGPVESSKSFNKTLVEGDAFYPRML